MIIQTAGTVTYRLINGQIQVLLVKPSKGKGEYQIPKGHVELSQKESIQDAAKRETLEETGIKVKLGDYIGSVKYPVPDGEKIVHAYLAEPVNPEQTPYEKDGENETVGWFGIGKLKNINKDHAYLILRGMAMVQNRLDQQK